MPVFQKIFWSFATVGGFYALFLGALINPSIQRFALYANKIDASWIGWDASKPETLGFAAGQITQFNVSTPDGEKLYAWHVMPVALYSKHEEEIRKQPSGPVDFKKSLAAKLLKDPESRVIINFHGNAGTVAQGHRTTTYRSLSSLPLIQSSSDPNVSGPIHLFAFDYRGFGVSTGSPTETGLITDGIAFVNYILSLGIPPNRIVLLGQSLGTAVASAVASHFADPGNESLPKEIAVVKRKVRGLMVPEPVDFAAVILVAPFANLPDLVKSYRIMGIIPILEPLRLYPKIQKFLSERVVDTWFTQDRVRSLVTPKGGSGGRLRLHIIHALNDMEIPYQNAEELFFVAANAYKETSGSLYEFRESLRERRKANGIGAMETLEVGDNRKVFLEVVGAGGHNLVMTYTPVVLAVLKAFEEVSQ
ncbi:alpha/beta-hydrolase [Aulographum hederae CBS 113979]|uniref:Alpha/beta-hydrolase n=1 Tax=Aulographum hederae CBS 113979 TaxID=1176131 RepID=A0A6G1HBK7_9PEZI|nr:alpha/beta-hydrolase [Aulographum hederae CBS 113979]